MNADILDSTIELTEFIKLHKKSKLNPMYYIHYPKKEQVRNCENNLKMIALMYGN